MLEVERASVWRLVDGGAAIECIDLFERSQGRHSSGTRISAADAPRYFAALQRERAIRAHDARTDTRTSEFRKGYLVPLGITSMLDAPVFLRGKMVGVVCHEHTGRARRWKLHEELLASSFADFVALVLETAAWHEAEDALRIERDALESKVAERTRDLQDSEANLRALVDFSPVAMVLTRIADSNGAAGQPAGRGDVRRGAERDPGTPRAPALGEPGRARALPGARLAPRAHRRLRGRDAHRERADVLGAPVGAAPALRRRRRAAGGDRRRHRAAAGAREICVEQATHDPLTGMFNRRHVEEVLRQEVDRAQRHARPLAVAMLDADHFKAINDTYGHQTGDEVLRAISDRCQKTLRANDVLGRYGGEEFVVVFPETNLEDAGAVAERLRAAVAEHPIKVGDKALAVTVSIGLAAFAPGQDLEKLFQRADSALYTAKQDGRNLVRAWGGRAASGKGGA